MFNTTLDTQYSKMLGKLIFYLIHNKKNLNQYALVRPYHLLTKLALKYKWNARITLGCSDNVHTNNSNNSFRLVGWNKAHGFDVNDVADVVDSCGIGNVVVINPVHLAINNYNAVSAVSKVTLFAYKFRLMHSDDGNYIHMLWNRPNTPTIKETIDCFIGSIRALKSAIDYSSRLGNHNDTKSEHDKVVQQAKNIKNGKYSWNKVFAKD